MAYDNTCKYIAEKYPQDIVRWLLSVETGDIQVLKTELNLEPIRADSLTFLRVLSSILHIEFQTLPSSTPPLPFLVRAGSPIFMPPAEILKEPAPTGLLGQAKTTI